MTDRVGQQLGNYRLIRFIGYGGFADTYLGEQVYLKTFAAIKVLRTQLAQNDQQAFYNEARTIAQLRHPNIVRVLEFGVESYTNTPYLVMEYAPNGTLRQRHPRGTILAPATVVSYVKHIAAALQYAHDQKLIHRDVKPENMLLGASNEVLLSDFGIAVIAQSTRAPMPQDVAGTVTFMAPEQIQGKPRPASDQYALAVVVYEWLCGVPPFHGTYIEVAVQHERMAPPLLREHVQTILPNVEQVVLTGLAKDPQRRFGSVQAFATALEQASKLAPPLGSPLDPQVYKPTELVSSSAGSPTSSTEQASPPIQSSYGILPAYPPAQPPYPPPETPSGGIPNPYAARQTPSGSIPNPYAAPPPPPGVPNSYTVPQTVPQAPYNPPIAPASLPRPRAGPSLSRGMTILLIVLAALLIVGGGGLIYYTTVFQPNQLHAQATATVVAKITGTAHANATSTAQALATTQAQVNATATVAAQATAQAQATATALQMIYTQATSGTPAISDPLSGGDNFGWDQYSVLGGGCAFRGGTYHSSAPPTYFTTCFANQTNFSNFALQVQMTILSGHSGGIVFRGDSQQQNFYAFRISTDGSYILAKIAANSAGQYNLTTLTSGSNNPAIHQGNNASNLIAVVAQGNTFYLYVNGQYVDQASDSTNKSGEIGVYTHSDAGSVEATFSNLKVWRL